MSHHPTNSNTSNRQPFGIKNQQSAAARAAAAALNNQNKDSNNNNNDVNIEKKNLNLKQAHQPQHSPLHPTTTTHPTPHRSLSSQRTTQQSHQPVTTPKKRAVPHEDVHCRNVVVEDRDRDSPSKRSRSSKDSSNEGNTDPSTGSGLARGMGGVSVETSNSNSNGGTSSRPVSSISTSNARQLTTNPTATTRPTTKRIDKASRMTEAERLHRERNKLEETKIWRQKYAKAFPSFHFYLDSLDDVTRAAVEGAIEQFGGKLEPFFSREVTHVVTSRRSPIRPPVNPAKVDSKQDGTRQIAPMPLGTSQGSRLRNLKSKTERGKNKQVPLHSDRNPFDEPGPAPAPNDLLVKAQGFGMKVWELEKFNKVIGMLRGEDATAMVEAKPELAQLLRQEKVQGTTERDPATQRGDFYYFGKNANYILIDDATGEHRHIMAREFKRVDPREEPPWPVIYGEIEGRCPFTKFNVTDDARRRQRPTQTTSLRRTVSLSQLNRNGTAPPSPRPYNEGFIASNHRAASPYPMASGNSMSIASRITSQTSQAFGSSASFGGANSSAPFDKRLANLGGRFHTPVSGASFPSRSSSASGLGLGGNSPINSSTANLNNPDGPPVEATRGVMIRKMLGMTEGKPIMRRALTTGASRPRRKEKKEGHCENCRQQFSDFDDHVRSNRHRKFARNDNNFVDIDSLIHRVQRPFAPDLSDNFDPNELMEDVDGSSGVGFNGNEASWQDYQEGMGHAISGSGSDSRQFEEEFDGSGFSEYYHVDPSIINNNSNNHGQTFVGGGQVEGSSREFSTNRRVATPDTSPNMQASVREAKAEAAAFVLLEDKIK